MNDKQPDKITQFASSVMYFCLGMGVTLLLTPESSADNKHDRLFDSFRTSALGFLAGGLANHGLQKQSTPFLGVSAGIITGSFVISTMEMIYSPDQDSSNENDGNSLSYRR